MRAYFQEILHLMGPDRRRLPRMVLLFLLASGLDLIGLGLIVPYFYLIMGMATDGSALVELFGHLGLQDAGREQLMLFIGGILVFVFLIKTVLGLWGNYSILRFSQDQQIRLKSILMDAYQSMPYTEYLRRNSVEYIHSIQSLTSTYANSAVVPLLKITSDGIVAVAILCFLAWKNFAAFALMMVVFGAVIGAYHWLFRGRLKSYGQQVNHIARQVGKTVRESMDGFKEIRILGKETYFHDEVDKGAHAYAKAFVHTQVITTAPRYLLELLLISFITLLVWITVVLGRDLQTLSPILALFGMAAFRLLPMINSFSSGLLSLRFAQNSVAQLHTDLQRVSGSCATEPRSMPKSPLPVFRSLRLEQVGFHYAGSKTAALDGISMEIRAGESIGLIGTSGSGKTTLVDVLLGLLEPQLGVIKYNDQSLHGNLPLWRRQVAYLPQQVFLMDDTLSANVALGERPEHVDQRKLQQALSSARLDELVGHLPQGINTLLGERGVRLSGGQRQRIAIARAFYYGRDVLVMDEATSALDNETEQEIVEEIQKLKGQKTMIVIAHRLTTVRYCDRIYRLEKGGIVECGTPEKMLG